MACRDARDDSSNINTELYQKISEMEAIQCAVFNELQRRGILAEVIKEAETNGRVEIQSVYDEHVRNDKARLKRKMEKEYSLDEISLMKEILKGD